MLSAFDLDDPTSPLNSKRHRAFTEIVGRAKALLACGPSSLSSRKRKIPDANTDDEKWKDVDVNKYYKDKAQELAERLSNLGHHYLIISFDECRLLNSRLSGSPRERWDREMSLTALQRVIKAADQHEPDSFKYWFTFIDTNPSAFLLVPPRGNDAPSTRLAQTLDPLPPWPFLGFDQMAPEKLSTKPIDALALQHLKAFGRPVSSLR